MCFHEHGKAASIGHWLTGSVGALSPCNRPFWNPNGACSIKIIVCNDLLYWPTTLTEPYTVKAVCCMWEQIAWVHVRQGQSGSRGKGQPTTSIVRFTCRWPGIDSAGRNTQLLRTCGAVSVPRGLSSRICCDNPRTHGCTTQNSTAISYAVGKPPTVCKPKRG